MGLAGVIRAALSGLSGSSAETRMSFVLFGVAFVLTFSAVLDLALGAFAGSGISTVFAVLVLVVALARFSGSSDLAFRGIKIVLYWVFPANPHAWRLRSKARPNLVMRIDLQLPFPGGLHPLKDGSVQYDRYGLTENPITTLNMRGRSADTGIRLICAWSTP